MSKNVTWFGDTFPLVLTRMNWKALLCRIQRTIYYIFLQPNSDCSLQICTRLLCIFAPSSWEEVWDFLFWGKKKKKTGGESIVCSCSGTIRYIEQPCQSAATVLSTMKRGQKWHIFCKNSNITSSYFWKCVFIITIVRKLHVWVLSLRINCVFWNGWQGILGMYFILPALHCIRLQENC